ncbi:F0F1 ATP synthase subunit A [Pseudobutyrivibrio xylanivorans]|uniref:ATP synthase subunit a n=1 Tax=Pseudobutyrivibrio xylanivorans TaxID=185007 RepID=A0A5P6VP23_PSEXY|nr:F0F1 ATP synthase subunit A [Pseudobutyrivibrio xylanivorans]QFJ54433.1 F0F1 ATP synthase subunit A [Pseudobutyrivibrio xylanivorans]
MDLAEKLVEELNCETVFTIHVGSLEIPILESVVVTWIVMAILILFGFLMTRGLKTQNIGKRQAFAEFVYEKLTGIVGGTLGEEGEAYVPYLVTVLLYIGVSDIIGLFGFKSPTKDLNVTIALALMSIILVEAAGIYQKGTKKWLHAFVEPVPIVTPFNILDVFTRPLSLCMRLFGNVLGAFVIMEMLKIVVPPIIPAIFSVYFDIFDGLLQAYVFVFLTSLYIKEAIE